MNADDLVKEILRGPTFPNASELAKRVAAVLALLKTDAPTLDAVRQALDGR